jgi:hypothetical protein
MKRINEIRNAVFFVALFTGFILSGFGQNAGGFEYKTHNGAITITGYEGSAKDVIIPEKIYGQTVVAVGYGAFFRKGITSITLPNTITHIEDRAFSYNRLTTLSLPNSLVSIGFLAFSNNRLKNITLPGSLVSIGMWAFSNNRLKNITLPASLDYIGDGAFIKNYIDSVSVSLSVWAFNSRAFDAFVKVTWY